MNAVAVEIQEQYEKLMKEWKTREDIAELLTVVILAANLKDVADSPEQQLEKLNNDIENFTARCKN